MFENYFTLLGRNIENVSRQVGIPVQELLYMTEGFDEPKNWDQIVVTANIGSMLFSYLEMATPHAHSELAHIIEIEKLVDIWLKRLKSIKDVSIFIDKVYQEHTDLVMRYEDLLRSLTEKDLKKKQDFLKLPRNDFKKVNNQIDVFVCYTQLRQVLNVHEDTPKGFSEKIDIMGKPQLLETFNESKALLDYLTPNGLTEYFKTYLNRLSATEGNTFKAKKMLGVLKKLHSADDRGRGDPIPTEWILLLVEFSEIANKVSLT